MKFHCKNENFIIYGCGAKIIFMQFDTIIFATEQISLISIDNNSPLCKFQIKIYTFIESFTSEYKINITREFLCRLPAFCIS